MIRHSRLGGKHLDALLGLVAFVAVVFSVACRRPSELTLTILHTNDVHARFDETNSRAGKCRDTDREAGACVGGAARRATAIAQIRRASSWPVLLVDAGDEFQGTLYYNRFRGEVAAAVMNRLGYDAMTVGNHEFDDGPTVLAAFAHRLSFPLLGTNVDASADPDLEGVLLPSTILERGGRRIGIVGFITEETASLSQPGPNVSFRTIEEAVSLQVRALEKQHVNIVVALSHSGYDRDLSVAAHVPGIDVIVGGHTNTYLANDDPTAEGPYPAVLTGPTGDPVLVVTAFAYGKYLGRLDATFDRHGRLVSWSGGPQLLDAQVAEDSEMLALLAPFRAEVAEFANAPLGSAAIELRGDEASCRFAECNLGDLLADALLEHGRVYGAEIALQNAGGIRSSIAAGPITMGNVLEVLPFGNTISTFRLPGKSVRAALEHGVSQADRPNADGTGRFLQVAGLRYRWTATKPPGTRLVDVQVQTSDGDWLPLDDERNYRMVTNNFSRNGGDGFTMLEKDAIDPYDQGQVVADVFAEYIQRNSPISTTIDPKQPSRIARLDAP